jgi:hypothetical protein
MRGGEDAPAVPETKAGAGLRIRIAIQGFWPLFSPSLHDAADGAEGKAVNQVNINSVKLLKLLIGLSMLFVLLNLGRMEWFHVLGHEHLREAFARFDLDKEPAIPTWFSSMLLLAASVTLGVIAVEKRRRHERFAAHWVGLGVIFLGLSIDEIAGFHELLSSRMEGFHLTGVFFYAWVIPACIFVLIFALAYLRFLLHLGWRFGVLFAAAGTIYVFGAVGMEVVGAEMQQTFGMDSVPYQLAVTAEEGCEMLGASLFVYALLCYLQMMMPQVRIGLLSDERAPQAVPQAAGIGPQAAGGAEGMGVSRSARA